MKYSFYNVISSIIICEWTGFCREKLWSSSLLPLGRSANTSSEKSAKFWKRVNMLVPNNIQNSKITMFPQTHNNKKVWWVRFTKLMFCLICVDVWKYYQENMFVSPRAAENPETPKSLNFSWSFVIGVALTQAGLPHFCCIKLPKKTRRRIVCQQPVTWLATILTWLNKWTRWTIEPSHIVCWVVIPWHLTAWPAFWRCTVAENFWAARWWPCGARIP